ncbi:MAG: hypothetical protein FWH38_09195 [Treponema sp.]|nr:hypothetical protein [Treponema sp.]
MNGKKWDIPHFFSCFRMPKSALLLVSLVILALAAFAEFCTLGLAKRTFVFYAIDDGAVTVENRMLRVSSENPPGAQSREPDITRYVEEALLGPVSPNSMPLFSKETRLRSLLYRDGVVYADLSEEAALPLEGSPLQGGEVLVSLKTLQAGIRRNFPFVRGARFFIAGKAAYSAEFRLPGELAGPEG